MGHRAAFRTHSEGTRERRLKARNEFRLRDLLTHRFLDYVERDLLEAGEFEALVARIAARRGRSLHRGVGYPCPGASKR